MLRAHPMSIIEIFITYNAKGKLGCSASPVRLRKKKNDPSGDYLTSSPLLLDSIVPHILSRMVSIIRRMRKLKAVCSSSSKWARLSYWQIRRRYIPIWSMPSSLGYTNWPHLQLLEIRTGPGAAIMPSEVTRIHMDFALKRNNGHLGPRYNYLFLSSGSRISTETCIGGSGGLVFHV